MCIVFLHFCDNPKPDGYRLIIASNRDEFYFRPTASARFWEKNPNIVAGMDMEPGKEGGTWLGISKLGRFAAITNYRQAPKFIDPTARGRGNLVPDFLTEEKSVRNYLEGVSKIGDEYNGFNLLVGNLCESGKPAVGWYCNVEDKQVRMLTPGTHVLSNRVLTCAWPKMVYGKKRFTEILEKGSTKQELIDDLTELLNERQRHFPNEDDKTFIGPQDEDGNLKFINSCRAIFVNLKEAQYGTRTNTVMLVDAVGHVTYVERTMPDDATDPDEADWLVNTIEFDITEDEGDHIRSKTTSSNHSKTPGCPNRQEMENQTNGKEIKCTDGENKPDHKKSEQQQDKARKRVSTEGSLAHGPGKKIAI